MAGYSEFAYCYDALTENADYAARCDVLCSLLAAHGAGEGILLDLACGTGTLTAMLAAAESIRPLREGTYVLTGFPGFSFCC